MVTRFPGAHATSPLRRFTRRAAPPLARLRHRTGRIVTWPARAVHEFRYRPTVYKLTLAAAAAFILAVSCLAAADASAPIPRYAHFLAFAAGSLILSVFLYRFARHVALAAAED